MTTDAIYDEAIRRFDALFQRAGQAGLDEPAAVTLATVDASGQPAARVVLLRDYDHRGFVFFTNSNSAKGAQLAANPRAALCCYWDPLHEQVRIGGRVRRVDDDASDRYWQSRARASQIGAWASAQSEVLVDRGALEQRVERVEQEYANGDVPRPPHWYGYRVVPERIEFWSGRPARLHDRTVYESRPDGWTRFLLYP